MWGDEVEGGGVYVVLGGGLGALGGGNGRVMGWDEGIMRGLGGVDGGGIWYWERV